MQAAVAVFLIQAFAVAAAVWLSGRRRLLEDGLSYLVSLAIGVLLATALLHILPDAVTSIGNRQALWIAFAATLFGMFCVERLFAAFTGNAVEVSLQQAPDSEAQHWHGSASPLSLVLGGVLHSFVDGLSVAAAFASGRRVGWLTAAAITLHEVPHRMGDYALLLHLRVSARRALQLIVLIALAALVGVLLVLVIGRAFTAANWLLPVSAASFVYIALVNLLPEIAREREAKHVSLQLLCMVLGAAFVVLLLRLPG